MPTALITIVEYLPSAALIVAVGVACVSVVNGVLALRATGRAKALIAQSGSDKVRNARNSTLSDPYEAAAAREAVGEVLGALSKEDRKFVETGMNQASRAGERRYLQDLLSER